MNRVVLSAVTALIASVAADIVVMHDPSDGRWRKDGWYLDWQNGTLDGPYASEETCETARLNRSAPAVAPCEDIHFQHDIIYVPPGFVPPGRKQPKPEG